MTEVFSKDGVGLDGTPNAFSKSIIIDISFFKFCFLDLVPNSISYDNSCQLPFPEHLLVCQALHTMVRLHYSFDQHSNDY